MLIGLYDVDSSKFPNLALMKISAYHKAQGDEVEFIERNKPYDVIYVSKIFGDEYSSIDREGLCADKIIFGGTGFAITVENGQEVFHKELDKDLPPAIEHMYPDYSLYPEYTQDKAYGFLTRGCCNNCNFCIVSKKEGMCSHKVADLSEWWHGQKEIILLDPNLLACKDRIELLQQLIDSKAKVNFTQGLDARFVTQEVADMLKQIKTSMWHFAFDYMKNEKAIVRGLEIFSKTIKVNPRKCCVYILTNYNTTFEEDMYRINKVREFNMTPDVRIYRKPTAPRLTRDLQRWCNNKIIYHACPDFMSYVPRVDGKSIKELYFAEKEE